MRSCSLPRAPSEQHLKVFEFLLEVNAVQGVGATLRVAGGWVRDSILGIPSHDIDIALETPNGNPVVTGEAFAKCVIAYQELKSMKTKSMSVIKTNPEMSKHIETAQVTVLGEHVEFCHLRHDEYCHTTRIPIVRPGSPFEDASRRDFTVNALFYNLHTQQVEDYTTGLIDIEKRLLRCPLSPKETFLDDPLRLLRGVRFAGQLDFTLDASIAACVDEELLHSLETKVSRERLGVEWTKMMTGRLPAKCWSLIVAMGLERSVLQEYYVTSKGKVERVGTMLPVCEEHQRAVYAWWENIVSPLFAVVQSVVERAQCQSSDVVVAGCMSVIAAPLLVGANLDELRDRVSAWSTHSLKLPGNVAGIARRILEAIARLAEIPWISVLSSESFAFCGPHRDRVFEALLALNDRSVPPCALMIAVAIATAQQNAALFATDANSMMMNIASKLEADPSLMASASCPLPIRGDELPKALGIANKEIGTTLLEMRRFLLHHPGASKTEVLLHLSNKQL